ncbi:hypothetical protein J6590_022977 [Homalodisca vitripennis]|nr:hypothetical protein J6590_022977 [Homalodisca vitripennis]
MVTVTDSADPILVISQLVQSTGESVCPIASSISTSSRSSSYASAQGLVDDSVVPVICVSNTRAVDTINDVDTPRIPPHLRRPV